MLNAYENRLGLNGENISKNTDEKRKRKASLCVRGFRLPFIRKHKQTVVLSPNIVNFFCFSIFFFSFNSLRIVAFFHLLGWISVLDIEILTRVFYICNMHLKHLHSRC